MELSQKTIKLVNYYSEQINLEFKNKNKNNLVLYLSNTDNSCRIQELDIFKNLHISPENIFVNLENEIPGYNMNSNQLLWYILDNINTLINLYPEIRTLNLIIFLDGDKLLIQDSINYSKKLLEFYNIFGNKLIKKLQTSKIELVNCQIFHSTNKYTDFENLGLGFLNIKILSKVKNHDLVSLLKKMTVFQYQKKIIYLPKQLRIHISCSANINNENIDIIDMQNGNSLKSVFHIEKLEKTSETEFIITNKIFISNECKFQIYIDTHKKYYWNIYTEQRTVTQFLEEKINFVYPE